MREFPPEILLRYLEILRAWQGGVVLARQANSYYDAAAQAWACLSWNTRMKKMILLVLAACMALSNLAMAAAPDAANIKAVQDLLVAMQSEKKLRMTAGMARYGSDKQRQDVMAKIEKVTASEAAARLAPRIAPFVTTETATEMTRFYQSSYGQKVLTQTYNSGPGMYAKDPVPTKAEQAELKKPAYLKADKELKAADAAIHKETFTLVTEIAKK